MKRRRRSEAGRSTASSSTSGSRSRNREVIVSSMLVSSASLKSPLLPAPSRKKGGLRAHLSTRNSGAEKLSASIEPCLGFEQEGDRAVVDELDLHARTEDAAMCAQRIRQPLVE